MKYLYNYKNYLLENKKSDYSISINDILNILENQIDIFREFNINKDIIPHDSNINDLYTNKEFINTLNKQNLKLGKIDDTKYNETMLNDNSNLIFFFIYDKNSIELEEPRYVILQYHKNDKKSDLLGFTNTKHINDFYKKLTDATIELSDGKNTYIYQTTNGGNNWEMKNVQMEDDTMKSSLDNEQLNDLIKQNKLKIKNV